MNDSIVIKGGKVHNLKNITFYYYALVLKTKAMYNKGKLKSS